MVLALGHTGSAHQLDEYLQAAQISIDPSGITLDLYLTPGVAVAPSIIRAIDTNHDGTISSREGTAYAALVLGSCALSVDGRQVAMNLDADEYPAPDDMRHGLGTIHIRATSALVASGGGSHVAKFENRFDPHRSVYLANAMLPRDPRITIRKQERDSRQSRIAISYDMAASESKAIHMMWLLVGLAAVCGSIFSVVRRNTLAN